MFDDKAGALRTVIEELGVQVRDRSGWQSIKCIDPRHHDRHASASINLTIGRYKCHACGLSGDGYDMAHELLGRKAVDMENETPFVEEETWF